MIVYSYYPKRKVSCGGCEFPIYKGANALVVGEHIRAYIGRNGTEKRGYAKRYYHFGCGMDFLNGELTDWFMQHEPEKVILGRPTKSFHPVECQRLKSLLRYHQKADNIERVEEIKAQLIVLETGMASEEDSPAEEEQTGLGFDEQLVSYGLVKNEDGSYSEDN